MSFEFRLTTHKMNHTIATARNFLLNSFQEFGKIKRNMSFIYNRNVMLQWTEEKDINLSIRVGLMAMGDFEYPNNDLFPHFLCYFPPENYTTGLNDSVFSKEWMEGIKGELQTFDDEHDRLSDHKSQSDQEETKEEAKEEVKKIEEAPKPPSPPKKKPLGKPRLAPRKITKTRASSYQMPSMRNKPTAKRSKIVKVLPGQEKPSKIQIFNKKPVMTKKKKKELEEKKRKDLELIRKRKQEEEEEKKAMMKVSTSLPEISHPEERVGGMLKGFNLKRTRTPANNNERVLIFSKRSDSEDPASDDENHYAFDKNDVEQYRRMGGYDNIRVREKKKEQELKRMLKSSLSHKKRRILTKIKAGMGFLKSSSRVNPIPDYNQPEKKVRIKDL